jgi:hypothetical protein
MINERGCRRIQLLPPIASSWPSIQKQNRVKRARAGEKNLVPKPLPRFYDVEPIVYDFNPVMLYGLNSFCFNLTPIPYGLAWCWIRRRW